MGLVRRVRCVLRRDGVGDRTGAVLQVHEAAVWRGATAAQDGAAAPPPRAERLEGDQCRRRPLRRCHTLLPTRRTHHPAPRARRCGVPRCAVGRPPHRRLSPSSSPPPASALRLSRLCIFIWRAAREVLCASLGAAPATPLTAPPSPPLVLAFPIAAALTSTATVAASDTSASFWSVSHRRPPPPSYIVHLYSLHSPITSPQFATFSSV
mmetsp:Transcript_19241/g.33042  ORF Transcript_19241/g.33042 Transcript_19241/m.33042 type:complete len:209 (-) Transcript_19241:208-834(-)